MFSFGADQTHVAVTANARVKLERMAEEVAGKEDLVAIYIPEGTDDVYQVGAQRGRVVGAVRLLQMPAGLGVEHFRFFDWDQNDRNRDWKGSVRWPIGWPCRAVLKADPTECPALRSLVEVAYGGAAFASYTAAFQHGPFKLDHRMSEAVTDPSKGSLGRRPGLI